MLVELDHKAMWAMNKVKMTLNEAMELRRTDLNDLDDFLSKAYERSSLYKEKMNKYHD